MTINNGERIQVSLPSNENPHSSFRYISTFSKRSSQSCGVTAPFSNIRTLKFKAQPKNAFSSQSCSVDKEISLCISWIWALSKPENTKPKSNFVKFCPGIRNYLRESKLHFQCFRSMWLAWYDSFCFGLRSEFDHLTYHRLRRSSWWSTVLLHTRLPPCNTHCRILRHPTHTRKQVF